MRACGGVQGNPKLDHEVFAVAWKHQVGSRMSCRHPTAEGSEFGGECCSLSFDSEWPVSMCYVQSTMQLFGV